MRIVKIVLEHKIYFDFSLKIFQSHEMKSKTATVFAQNERELIEEAYVEFGKNIKAMAIHLGISRGRALRKLKRYGLYEPLRRGK